MLFPKEQHDLQNAKNDTTRWVDFYQEKIEFTLSEFELNVKGVYYLENLTNGNISMEIIYPFPIDQYHPYPHKIEVTGIEFIKSADNISFNFNLAPNEKKNFTIIYSQKHYNNTATYILKTTHKWQTPLKKAEYILNTPVNWQCQTSLTPEKIIIQGNIKIYQFEKHNFLPMCDFIVSWDNKTRQE